MIIPEFLYRLNVQDQGKQTLTVAYGEVSASDTAVEVGGTIYEVPKDKCCVLTHAATLFQPGGAQNVALGRILVSTPEADRQWELAFAGAAGSSTWQVLNWSGQVIVPPGYRVRVSGTYSAGAVSNTSLGACHGVLIPRGSFTFDA